MACQCGTNLRELGMPNCNVLMGTVRRLLFSKTEDLHIENADAILTDELYNDFVASQNGNTTAYFTWINFAATELLLSETIENFEATKDDSVKETFNSGAALFVREGLWTFQFVIPAAPFAAGVAWKDLRCARDLKIYLIDSNGRLWGQKETLNDPVPNVYPLKILDGSFDAKPEFTTDSTIQKWIISFQLDPSVQDEMLVGLGQTAKWLTHKPPVPVTLQAQTIPAAGNTSGVFNLLMPFQTQSSGTPAYAAPNGLVYGLTNSNFQVLINGTTQTITVTETLPGYYNIDWSTALVSGNTIEIRFLPAGLPYLQKSITFQV